MGDLRDQLKKAKLLSDKKARQLAHEERVHRKKVGREGLEKEQSERQAELAEQRDKTREQDRAQQQAHEAERKRVAEGAACTELLRREVIKPRGRSRWYFQLQDGALPWFDVDESTRFEIDNGNFWVVRIGPPESHHYALMASEHAKRVRDAIPEAVAWAPGGLG